MHNAWRQETPDEAATRLAALQQAQAARVVSLPHATARNSTATVLEACELSLVRGDSITPEPVSWIWDGWLAAGKFHVLAGQPGTGKTTLALAFAATITSGGRWPDNM